MADDQNIDVNINTVVDRESLDQLNGDLSDLENNSISIPVDTSGVDDLKNDVGGANNEVGGLKDDLNSINGDGPAEAARGISQITTGSVEAASSVDDLTNVLSLISSAIAVGGVVIGINSIASSADSVNETLNAMQINFNLDPSGLTAATDSINTLNSETGVAKGSIRDLDNAMGMAGVSSVDTANGVIKVASQLSYLKTGSNDATETLANMFSKSITSGKMAEKAYASNGISLDQMAQRAGMTKDQMTELFATMTPDERANFLQKYAVDSGKAEEANEGLKESYDTLKDEATQKMGALGTAFGQTVLPILIPALNVAIWALGGFAGVINSLPDFAKTAIGVGILAGGLAIIGAVIMTTVIPAISSAILGFGNLFVAQGTTLVSTGGLAGALSSSFFAFVAYVTGTDLATAASLGFTGALRAMLLAMVTNPIFLVAMAIIGLVIAIEKFGEYMGWWKDWGSMVDAFRAGIMRLWDAFINNAQVQVVIEWLKAAWQGVLDFLQPVFDVISQLWATIFPPQQGGFDIVLSIINLFGWLGASIASLIGFIQSMWPLVTVALGPVLVPLRAIISVLQLVYSNFGRVIAWFQSGAAQIRGFIDGLKAAWNSFASGVTSAYNTYIAPIISAMQNGVKTAQDVWNAITNGGASGGSAAGGYLSAAGGGSSTELQKIDYPEKNHYDIHFNGLVTEQSMIDYLLKLIEKGNDQEDSRT